MSANVIRFLEDANAEDLLAFLEELYPHTSFSHTTKDRGESEEDYQLRCLADRETYLTMMASNTALAAEEVKAIQIAKVIRKGYHLATTQAKRSNERVGRRDAFLSWLEFVGFNYTTNQSERTRLVTFYLETLPLLEGVAGTTLSNDQIANLHKDQGDITAKYIQRIANELTETLNRLDMLDKKTAQRILDELGKVYPNATELEKEIRAKIEEATPVKPVTLSETSVTFDPKAFTQTITELVIEPPQAFTREIHSNRVKITIEADRALLPVIKAKMLEIGIDLDSLRVIE